MSPVPVTRKMSDRHEEDLAELLGGKRTRNSGAVWSDQSDGHHLQSEEHWRFAWDGKSTLGKSIGITRDMVTKLRQQSRGLLPLLPLRWYRDNRLTGVDIDMVALDLETFVEILDDANLYRRMKDTGCHLGTHDDFGVSGGECRVCGSMPYERTGVL